MKNKHWQCGQKKKNQRKKTENFKASTIEMLSFSCETFIDTFIKWKNPLFSHHFTFANDNTRWHASNNFEYMYTFG